ncbi:MAG: ATP-binding protein [Bacteriovoracia bacterium]
MEVTKYIFLFLIGTSLLSLIIATAARVKTGSKQFNDLILYWISLFVTYGAVAVLRHTDREIAYAFFFQVLPTMMMAKILSDSRGIKINRKFHLVFWAITAITSSALIEYTDVGFTLSLLPVTFGTTIIYYRPVVNTLVSFKAESNWIEKGMALVVTTGIVNLFNYAFFRLDPDAQWWGWSLSIAQYQCLSIFLPLLINHRRAENERKNIEQALQKLSVPKTNYHVEIDDLYKTLELQIIQKEELTSKLQKANENLEEEREMNEILIKTVSHDLANPLTVVNAYIDMIILKRVPPEDLERIIGKIQLNSNAALDMISRIRTAIVTRSHANLINVHAVSVERTLTKLLENFETRLNDKKIRVNYKNEAPLDTFVMAEENALIEHVFTNILSNSVKFSHQNSTIDIAVTENNQNVKIEFKDHGLGISRQRLNTRLLNSTEGTQGEGGTGFGVMILGYFLRKFGGSYSITSEGINKGTTVTVNLKKSEVKIRNLERPAPSANIYS